jgi:phage shock protein E
MSTSTFTTDDDNYQKRSAENVGGFCTPLQVQQALADPTTIVLDTRTLPEIEADGRVQHVNYKHVTSCTAESCPDLMAHTERFVPDNVDKKTVTIVVYCRSGRRAAKAKQTLVDKGYTHVLNAGGYSDVMRHLSQQQQQQQQQQQ